jgi:hypothetical protein
MACWQTLAVTRKTALKRRTPLKRSNKGLGRRVPLARSTKPIPRGKPLQRSAKPIRKRMTTDPASFRDEDIIAVHGPSPSCLQTGKRPSPQFQVEKHHVLGRGGKGPEQRRVHSSVLNCAPLIDLVHAGPLRDDPAQRWVYLRIAFEKAMEAVGQGRYALTDIDRAFVAHARATGDGMYASVYDGLPAEGPG